MSRSFPYLDNERIVLSRGKKKAVILFPFKILFSDRNCHIIIKAFVRDAFLGDFFQFRKIFFYQRNGHFLTLRVGKQLCCKREYVVADFQFQFLISFRVGICSYVKPEKPLSRFFDFLIFVFFRVCGQRQQRNGHYQHNNKNRLKTFHFITSCRVSTEVYFFIQ